MKLDQGPLKGGGGVQTGGLPDLDLSFHFCPFCPFPIFPGFSRFARGWSGDFPDSSLSLSRPIKSTYEEQSRKGPRHNLTFPQKSGKPPGLASLRFSLPQLDLRSRPPFTGVPRRPGRKVPHGVLFECFWAPGSECPKKCFLSVFGHLSGLKSFKKHSKNTLWGTPSQVPIAKALRGALSGPGPWALL